MKFSVIIPHYDQSISDEVFCRGIQSLLDQTYKNFEVLIYHDGPVSRPVPEIWKKFGDRCHLEITKNRENNWGHGNRDKGIKKAKGEYIVHFNPDNILYPEALNEVNKVSNLTYEEYPCAVFDIYQNKIIGICNKHLDVDEKLFRLKGTNNIIIIPIYMIGHVRYGFSSYLASRDLNLTEHKHLFTGDPVVLYNIDCLQLIMKRDLWLKYGGWYDKSRNSDGVMYPKFAEDYGARYCDKVLGEHW